MSWVRALPCLRVAGCVFFVCVCPTENIETPGLTQHKTHKRKHTNIYVDRVSTKKTTQRAPCPTKRCLRLIQQAIVTRGL